jgi:hypothetical protein
MCLQQQGHKAAGALLMVLFSAGLPAAVNELAAERVTPLYVCLLQCTTLQEQVNKPCCVFPLLLLLLLRHFSASGMLPASASTAWSSSLWELQ